MVKPMATLQTTCIAMYVSALCCPATSSSEERRADIGCPNLRIGHRKICLRASYGAGYDNMEVNLEPVLDYLKAQNYKALEHEQSAKRVAGMDKWEVSQVVFHGCLVLSPIEPAFHSFMGLFVGLCENLTRVYVLHFGCRAEGFFQSLRDQSVHDALSCTHQWCNAASCQSVCVRCRTHGWMCVSTS